MRTLAILLVAALLVCGCINFGGQITTNFVQQRIGPSGQDAPDAVATTQPAASNTAEISVEIHDGGTSVGLVNPPAPEPAATSQPSASGSP